MVGSHKILTVSYGTFSCTLEGFDDSFGTMKAIAEYFRDLAAEDRYFGAEPPTPDAEMLTRIAEREIARRVEARLDASGIVLRATGPGRAEAVAAPPPPAATPVTPATAPQEAPVAQAVAAAELTQPRTALPAAPEASPADAAAEDTDPQDPVPLLAAAESAGQTAADLAAVAEDAVGPMPEPMPVAMPPAARMPEGKAPAAAPRSGPRIINAPHAPLPSHPDQNSVAAKLERIRAVVGRADAPSGEGEDNAPTLTEAMAPPALAVPVAEVVPPALPKAEVPALAAATPATDPQPAAEAAQPVRARVIRMRRADFDRALAQGQLVSPAAAALLADTTPVEAPPAAATLSPEDEADLMAELAAVQEEASLFAATPEDEAEEQGDWEPVPAEDAAWTADDQGFAAEDDGTLTDAADEDERMAAVLAAMDDEAEAAAAQGADEIDMEALARALADPVPQTVDVAGMAIEAADAAPSGQDAVLAELTDSVDAADGGVGWSSTVDGADDGADDGVEWNSTVDEAAEDAAMIAEHDAALEAAIAAATAQDIDRDAATLAEAALERAALEEAEPAVDRIGEAAEPAPFAPEPVELADDLLASAAPTTHEHLRVQTDEAALDRIMSQTDAHLKADEASRRRAAITQLRAAVAATEAARRLGEAPEPQDDDEVENAFRDDLKQAVRPRRPVATGETRSDRPRPAPLKLVASQRIDQPAPAAVAPGKVVRPRRVSVAADPVPTAVAAETAGTTTFEDYAREVGATTLADLLEAAAAYTSFVEGIEDFSRPQLMKKVTGLDPDRFNREDTLRSFGTLLREGRITRSGMGRFQVSQENRFHPSRRAG